MAPLPNLIVIGSPKCGTTSLHYYLSLHPDIFMSRKKELRFFNDDNNWNKGIDWYKAQFETRKTVSIWGESSPGYTKYPRWPHVPERMHSVVPHARLIQIVRDPMARMISHYRQSVDAGELQPDLNREASRLGQSVIVMASRQCYQLEQYLPFYPMSQILVITQEDLLRNRPDTMRSIYRFLGVDDSFDSPKLSKILNASASKRVMNRAGRVLVKALEWVKVGQKIPPLVGVPLRTALLKRLSRPIEQAVLDPALEQRLLEIFRDDAERLRRLTGLKLEGWCV
ncbi:MAG TPA: sulfotransferase [Candidatus Binataceae bacterium]|nr:sulfotransferase [Candidatus Binataceae bacterium]